jgi:hypothetical protein
VNNIGLIGEGSDTVNDQLIPRYSIDGVDPLIFGGTYTGPAGYPQQGVYQIPPVPPAISDLAGQATIQSGTGAAGGGQVTAGMNGGGAQAPTMAGADGNVMSPTKGPVVMALIFLAVALIGLQWIHWRRG